MDAKQKSWTPDQTNACPIIFKRVGQEKRVGQGKVKKEVSNRQDKKSNDHRFFASFATDQNKVLPPSTTNP